MSYDEKLPSDHTDGSTTHGWEPVLLRSGVDQILEELSSRRRRLILLSLKRGTVETAADVMFRGDDDKESTEIDLRHNHLPKLAEAGYIEWDPDTGEISKGPRFEEIEPLLDLIENHADELPPGWP
jgi:hypothetical protein